MSWFGVVFLAVAAFLVGALLLRGARSFWTLFAATLVFGLAGYAWQGSPGYLSSPRAASDTATRANPDLINARAEFFDASHLPSRFVLTGDTYARRGDYETASGFYRNAVTENPDDGEAWLALGVALVEYSGGRGTPAALYAYQQARDALPGNPATGYFAGLPEVRSGRFPEAREIWAEALASASDRAEGRDYLASRIASLDELMAVMASASGS